MTSSKFLSSLRSIASPLLLIAVLLGSGILMWETSKSDSAIMDELAHIPAGYSYVRYLDFRLNPEHPPLVKILAGLPLLGLDLKFPTDQKSWTEDVNGQWVAGSQFLYESGNDANAIILWSRLGAILLTLLTTFLIYIWARELFGKWWALLPATLFAFSPSVLAHGHYVTTDIAATFGVLFGMYTFLKWILKPTKGYMILAGLGLGIALLLKFSLVLLVPIFFILIVLYRFFKWLRNRMLKKQGIEISGVQKRFWFYLKNFIYISIIACLLIYVIYFIFTFNLPQEKQVSDTTQILSTYNPKFVSDLVLTFVNNSVLRPFGHYLLGFFMVLQRSAGGNTGYFLGEVSNVGWWYYFPVVFLLKEPIPSLLLLLSSLGIGLYFFGRNLFTKRNEKWLRGLGFLETHFSEFATAFFVFIYWVYSMKSPLNIGFRHIIPTIPLIYILITAAFKFWTGTSLNTNLKSALGKMRHSKSFKLAFLFFMVGWLFVIVGITNPYYLSYFNEFGGSTWNGYKYVTDSNYDWGQDMLRLQTFVKEQNIKRIAVDYFGGGNAKYSLGETVAENWWSSRGNPKEEEGIEWIAISVNSLESAIQPVNPSATLTRNPQDEYRWLVEIRSHTPEPGYVESRALPPPLGIGNLPSPDFRVGTSIFVYHL